ncbi:MAG: hypothetical protein KAQ98_04715 [Bacteriovoracaceae bacterium]|nr:hypothetical protein [Bacteriovoracaceae bacterium]
MKRRFFLCIVVFAVSTFMFLNKFQRTSGKVPKEKIARQRFPRPEKKPHVEHSKELTDFKTDEEASRIDTIVKKVERPDSEVPDFKKQISNDQAFQEFMGAMTGVGVNFEHLVELLNEIDMENIEPEELVDEIIEILPYASREIFQRMVEDRQIHISSVKNFLMSEEFEEALDQELSDDEYGEADRGYRSPEGVFDE